MHCVDLAPFIVDSVDDAIDRRILYSGAVGRLSINGTSYAYRCTNQQRTLAVAGILRWLSCFFPLPLSMIAGIIVIIIVIIFKCRSDPLEQKASTAATAIKTIAPLASLL